MKRYRLDARQHLPATPTEAWAFFSDPVNLARITPPWLGFDIVSELPAEMHAGMIIEYRVRPFPRIPVTWVTEVTRLEPPHIFVDERRLGPYRFRHHRHHLRRVDDGVEVRGLVHYALPFGPLGEAIAGRSVGRRLREIFAFRRRVLGRIFALPAPGP